MSKEFVLGLDLGTSSVKGLLLRVDGTPGSPVIARLSVEYPLNTPRPGWSQQDPADWWRSVAFLARQILESTNTDPRAICALALSGQMHGAILLDGKAQVLRPAILWNDQRSDYECRQITKEIGLHTLLDWVGNPALPGFTAPKILWVRANEPELYSRIASILLPKDYINFKLTGQLATEHSDASGTLLFDVKGRRWSTEILQALDIPTSWLPQVHESTAVVGKVTPEAAQATGLTQGTPVVAGGADNACAAVGLGVVRSGDVMTSIGTSGTILAPSSSPDIDAKGRLHTFCHVMEDVWYVMGVVLSAGGSLRWFRDALGADEKRRGEIEGIDPYDVLVGEASKVARGSEGLLYLPYLSGERSPHGNPDARGAFIGLTLRHTKAHIVRSVLEGVMYAINDSAAIMRSLGLPLKLIRTTGGGSRSKVWCQIQAEVLNAPVETFVPDEGPALGAAIIAAVGIGAFESIERASERLVGRHQRFVPEADSALEYERYHKLYHSLYPTLASTFRKLSELN